MLWYICIDIIFYYVNELINAHYSANLAHILCYEGECLTPKKVSEVTIRLNDPYIISPAKFI